MVRALTCQLHLIVFVMCSVRLGYSMQLSRQWGAQAGLYQVGGFQCECPNIFGHFMRDALSRSSALLFGLAGKTSGTLK